MLNFYVHDQELCLYIVELIRLDEANTRMKENLKLALNSNKCLTKQQNLNMPCPPTKNGHYGTGREQAPSSQLAQSTTAISSRPNKTPTMKPLALAKASQQDLENSFNSGLSSLVTSTPIAALRTASKRKISNPVCGDQTKARKLAKDLINSKSYASATDVTNSAEEINRRSSISRKQTKLSASKELLLVRSKYRLVQQMLATKCKLVKQAIHVANAKLTTIETAQVRRAAVKRQTFAQRKQRQQEHHQHYRGTCTCRGGMRLCFMVYKTSLQ